MKMSINPIAQTDTASVVSPASISNENQNQSAPVEPSPAKTQPSTTDTVQISSSAKAMMQEAQETAAQTAQEAGRGDRQAERLLAKEVAARAQQEGNNQSSPLLSK
jgi:hypothetical protein